MSVAAYDKSRKVDANEMLNKKLKRMTFEMDAELHKVLKSASASEGTFIRDILVDATQEWLIARGYLKEKTR